MRPSKTMPRGSLVLTLVLSLCAVPAHAKEAVVGTPRPATSADTRLLAPPGFVVAYAVYAPGSTVASRLDATGAFSLSLDPGPYVLLARSTGPAPVTSVGYAMVRARKRESTPAKPIKVKFKVVKEKARSLARSASAAPRITPSPGGLPTGRVVSVGKIVLTDPSGTPFLDNGREQRIDGAFISDRVQSQSACPITLVEDREFGRFDAVTRELKLRSSASVPARQRVKYKKAIQTLSLWAPQYRVQGTASISSLDTQDSSETVTVHLEVVDLLTGEVVCGRDYTITAGRLVSDFPAESWNDLTRVLCGDPLPSVIRGTYAGSLVIDALGGVTETFDGDVSFVLQNADVYRQFPPAPGSGIYAVYLGQSLSIHWKIAGGAPCSYSGETSTTVPNPEIGASLLLEVNPADCEPRRYVIQTGFTLDTPTTMNISCPEGDIQTPKYYGGSIHSPEEDEQPLRVALGRLVGQHSVGTQNWSWAFDTVE